MKAVDTNLLVRFLVNDDEKQGKKVFKLFRDAELEGDVYFVSILVLLELIWVLSAVYERSKKDILNAIEGLNSMPILMIEKSDAVFKALHDAKKSNFDLPDLLIAYCSVSDGCESVLTFDRKAAKHRLFHQLG